MSITFTLDELAKHTNTEIKGNAERLLQAVAPVDQAGPADISFIRDRHYARFLQDSQAGAMILTRDLAAQYEGDCLISNNPYLTYSRITVLFHPVKKPDPNIAPSAVIADSVSLGENVSIGANVIIAEHCQIADNVVIEAGCSLGTNCTIGAGSYLHSNVSLYSDTQIGQSVIIHSGAVLGADGFGFVPNENKDWEKIPQVGRVRVGNNVEIGANTTIDRAALGETVLGNGVKLDNLIHIAHNVHIGDHTVMAACTGIAGSAKIGKYCQISGMCSIAGHLEVVDHVTITATSFVINSILEPGVYSAGTTVDEHKRWRKNAVRFRQLDQMSRKLNQLETQLQALTQSANNKD